MARYYKSRFLTEPVIYVQEDDSWSSYGPGGAIRSMRGEIPADIVRFVDEIPAADGQAWVSSRMAEAEGLERERPGSADPYAPDRDPRPGVGRYFVFVIIWMAMTVAGMLNLFRTGLVRLAQELPARITGSSLAEHPGEWLAMNVVDIIAAAALVGLAVLTVVFMVKRKRETRWLVATFAVLACVLGIFDLVMLSRSGVFALLDDVTYSPSADNLMTQAITGTIGGLMGLIMIAPYALTSERVKRTFDGRKRAPRTPAQRPTQAATWGAAPPAQPAATQPAPMPPDPTWPAAAPPEWRPAGPPEWKPAGPDRFCPACGSQTATGAHFCTACGAVLDPAGDGRAN